MDPPFDSKRDYNQIYNNLGQEDVAQAQAFTDTWIWDDIAIARYEEIIDNARGSIHAKHGHTYQGAAEGSGKVAF